MTISTILFSWGLPITAGCGSLIALAHFGLTRCLQACAAALWAAGIAYEEAKRVWKANYRRTMEGAL